MATASQIITVHKLDAACRQLRDALSLWFNEGDPVSIHTLACAAYEIIHVVSKKRNRNRELYFNSLRVKDEHRSEFNKQLKQAASFFKHANKDADAEIKFQPESTEMFFLFSILGLELINEPRGDEELAFTLWLCFHRQSWLSEQGQKRYKQAIAIDQLRKLESVPKPDFFAAFKVLLGDDDGGRLLARLDLGLDFFGGEIGRDPILRVGGGEPGLVGIDQAVDERAAEETCQPRPH